LRRFRAMSGGPYRQHRIPEHGELKTQDWLTAES